MISCCAQPDFSSETAAKITLLILILQIFSDLFFKKFQAAIAGPLPFLFSECKSRAFILSLQIIWESFSVKEHNTLRAWGACGDYFYGAVEAEGELTKNSSHFY